MRRPVDSALTAHLDLKNAIHVGHSTGGGEVAHYLGANGQPLNMVIRHKALE
jgi:pimeloyl-ACP methyl ester carboxylesterase